MEEKKCPICDLVVTGDVIRHLTSKEHEAALKVLLEKEAAQQMFQGRRHGGKVEEDIERLLTIIKRAPTPFGKTDSEVAQEYRNWYLGFRLNMKAAEQSFTPEAGDSCPPDVVKTEKEIP